MSKSRSDNVFARVRLLMETIWVDEPCAVDDLKHSLSRLAATFGSEVVQQAISIVGLGIEEDMDALQAAERACLLARRLMVERHFAGCDLSEIKPGDLDKPDTAAS